MHESPSHQTTPPESAVGPAVESAADTASEDASPAIHPWHRMVSIGDSFTEGVGDPDDSVPGGFRGWADRMAEELARTTEDFAYANLAVRGRLFQPIVDEQLEPALALHPDLVTISAGGNDMLRPGADPDDIAARLDTVITQIAETGATVVMFDGPDIGNTPVLRSIRGRVAIWNENVRVVAARHDGVMVDLWGLHQLGDPAMWAPDRLHFSPLGHQLIACEALDSLGIAHGLVPGELTPRPTRTWRQARGEDLVWARKYFVPWVGRRIRRRSSGDNITAKRPEFGRPTIPGAGEDVPVDPQGA
ncbi:SGNH hydrolase [Kocuria varians]|uniref:SGNH hydrolase n=1 Tax=Kocuria varians TaxID=1272 RepID=A0A4Y4D7Z0_KOCVA|nr:SGNH/GDSL hydrolase family protein [Kocuria varians]GEC99713.1 SGNH hydrolase [Kocuria varians]